MNKYQKVIDFLNENGIESNNISSIPKLYTRMCKVHNYKVVHTHINQISKKTGVSVKVLKKQMKESLENFMEKGYFNPVPLFKINNEEGNRRKVGNLEIVVDGEFTANRNLRSDWSWKE